jgi:hypothetical protein
MTDSSDDRISWADRHRSRLDPLDAAVLHGPGVLPAEVRQAAARNDGVQDGFETYVETIHRHAYRVTDATVADLAARTDDDTVFEISVAAAYGAARDRLDAGLRALRAATDGA